MAGLRAAAGNEAAELRASAVRETVICSSFRQAGSGRGQGYRPAGAFDELASITERGRGSAAAGHQVEDGPRPSRTAAPASRTTTGERDRRASATAKRADFLAAPGGRQMSSQAWRIMEERGHRQTKPKPNCTACLPAATEAERRETERHRAAPHQPPASGSPKPSGKAAAADAQTEQILHAAGQHSQQLASDANKHAYQTVAQARAQAERLDRHHEPDQPDSGRSSGTNSDELTRQKESISSYLALIRERRPARRWPPRECAFRPGQYRRRRPWDPTPRLQRRFHLTRPPLKHTRNGAA